MNYSDSNETFTSATEWCVAVTTSSNESEAVLFTLTANFKRVPMSVMLSTVAVFGNLLVIILIIKDKKLRRPSNYYILSLAANEVTVGLVSVNGMLIWDIYNGWPFGLLLCRVCALNAVL